MSQSSQVQGDPNHYWRADRVAASSGAAVICDEALEAVRIMNPALVLPCHYNCPDFFTNKYNPADDAYFKREVEKLGSTCVVLHNAESIEL